MSTVQHVSPSKNKTNYRKCYSNIRVGFGAHFDVKMSFRSIFSREFWHNLWWELRYAWLRATRGYDYPDVFSMDDRLKKYLVRILLDLADTSSTAPPLEEWTEKPCEEWHVLCPQRLVEIATHFYESLEWEESDIEKNEFEEEYFNSCDKDFEDGEDGCSALMIDIPKNGYTQEQVDILCDKWRNRRNEIEEYKHKQLELGMAKLTEAFPYLWD